MSTSPSSAPRDDYYRARKDDDDDDRQPHHHYSPSMSYSYSSHRHRHTHSDNYTITTSVTIRVTPRNDYLLSWGILWSLFVITFLVLAVQVYTDERKRRRLLRRGHGGVVSDDIEQGPSVVGDAGGFSSAHSTRTMFRRLLLLALFTRAILMPIQIWSDPIWWQFFGDTFPEMIFASAWTLLVSFFVQLVGLATGTGTNTSPSIVIQATAYVVYAVLITTQIWNHVATILLYALLSCIYAALFGTVIYFGPRLLSLLQTMHTTNGTTINNTSTVGSSGSSGNTNNLVSGVNGIRTTPHFGLLLRVSLCAIVTIALFAAHTVGYARLVVAPPRDVYWWINYGAMELLPAVILLVLMHPQQHGRGGRRKDVGLASGDDADEDQHHSGTPISSGAVKGLRRTDSTSSAASGNKRSTTPASGGGETTSLLKSSTSGPSLVYGSGGGGGTSDSHPNH